MCGMVRLLPWLVTVTHALVISDLRVNYMRPPPFGPLMGVLNATFSWQLTDPGVRSQEQTSYQVVVSQAGKTVWNSGKVNTNRNSARYTGPDLASDTPYNWNVTVNAAQGPSASASGSFVSGLSGADDFQGIWITGGDKAKQLRRQFAVPAGVVRATLYISGIGYYVASLNGRRVSDHVLDPGWTDYPKRVWYNAFDVTQLSKPGTLNVFAVTLGNGWFACAGGQPGCFNTPPQLLLQANFYDASGRRVLSVTSDTFWKVAAGPITYDSLYNGETYDSTKETPGWDMPGYDDSSWKVAVGAVSVANKALLAPAFFEPIRHVSAISPVSLSEPFPGVVVVDFGQNTAAVVRLRIRAGQAIRGKNVTLRHAELLTHPPYGPQDGSIYVGNLRAALATDVYVMRGDPDGEVYVPTFTQHGFRFAEITGLGYLPTPDEIEALEMHSDVQGAGSIAFPLALLNQIQHNVVWGQKSNFMSVPSDCPQRDERRGWMGDAGLTAEEALYNFHMGAFYRGFLDQIQDDQLQNGAVPNFVPGLGTGEGAPNWQTAYPTIVHSMYMTYGDSRVISEHWPSLLKYMGYFDVNYNRTGLKNFITGFGDWVPPPPFPQADLHLTSSFSYLRDHILFIDMANAIGDSATARRLQTALDSLRVEFHGAFFNSSAGWYGSGLQSEQAFGLWLSVPPTPEAYQKILDYFVHDITIVRGTHPTTGIIGWKYMLEVLSRNGLSDVALALNLQTTYPSFGYMILGDGNPEPATTVWELWDSDKEGPGMNSRNHIMFGSNSGWFYRSLAGIQTRGDGVVVAPSGINAHGLTTLAASAQSPFGLVEVSWSVSAAFQCQEVGENTNVSFSCPGSTISSVLFASFGTVQGMCPSLSVGSCNAPTSLSVVEKACVGRASCSVLASDSVFGDPCEGVSKELGVIVNCEDYGGYSVKVTLPVGPSSQVVLAPVASLNQTLEALTVGESSMVIWANQKFIPGPPGIRDGAVVDGAVSFTVDSGDYEFFVKTDRSRR